MFKKQINKLQNEQTDELSDIFVVIQYDVTVSIRDVIIEWHFVLIRTQMPFHFYLPTFTHNTLVYSINLKTVCIFFSYGSCFVSKIKKEAENLNTKLNKPSSNVNCSFSIFFNLEKEVHPLGQYGAILNMVDVCFKKNNLL